MEPASEDDIVDFDAVFDGETWTPKVSSRPEGTLPVPDDFLGSESGMTEDSSQYGETSPRQDSSSAANLACLHKKNAAKMSGKTPRFPQNLDKAAMPSEDDIRFVHCAIMKFTNFEGVIMDLKEKNLIKHDYAWKGKRSDGSKKKLKYCIEACQYRAALGFYQLNEEQCRQVKVALQSLIDVSDILQEAFKSGPAHSYDEMLGDNIDDLKIRCVECQQSHEQENRVKKEKKQGKKRQRESSEELTLSISPPSSSRML